MTMTVSPPPTDALPRASLADTLRFVMQVTLLNVAKGVIMRRPRMVALAAKLDLDTRAVTVMQHLKRTYGPGPLIIPVPSQPQAIVLDPAHVRTVLERTDEAYAAATQIKRSALSHFEPANVLASRGAARADRRAFNEDVLGLHQTMHQLHQDFVAVVEEEASAMLRYLAQGHNLTWDLFSLAWFRVVRRVVFGASARDDHALTAMIDQLRQRGNWGFLAPKNTRLRARFLARVAQRLAQAEPGSLAHVIAQAHTTPTTQPEQQVPQWLFAFDPAGMTTHRALAVLASQPGMMGRARAALAAGAGSAHEWPFLRACILETLRLWPTTPVILRETKVPTVLGGGTLPAPTNVFIYTPFFHRDDERVPFAHQFTPDVWLHGSDAPAGPAHGALYADASRAASAVDADAKGWPFVPFSSGPGTCPGRQLVLLTTTAMLAAIIGQHHVRLTAGPDLSGRKPMPGTLNNYALRFALTADEPVRVQG